LKGIAARRPAGASAPVTPSGARTPRLRRAGWRRRQGRGGSLQ